MGVPTDSTPTWASGILLASAALEAFGAGFSDVARRRAEATPKVQTNTRTFCPTYTRLGQMPYRGSR